MPTRNRWYKLAAFLPPGDRLAVVESDEDERNRWLMMRDADTGKKREEVALPGGATHPSGLLVFPDGSRLLVVVGPSFHVLEPADLTRTPRRVVGPDRAHFPDLAFHPSGRILATVGNSWAVRFWDTASWAESRVFEWGIGKLQAVAFSPDGTRAAVGSQKGGVMVWDVDL
ncbi:MAG TPA: WD40 repeat domain-containing protein [Gemmataceae bacterium]|nr:WD40 repeat domain-containing protein [Gemmataceae bacterium]